MQKIEVIIFSLHSLHPVIENEIQIFFLKGRATCYYRLLSPKIKRILKERQNNIQQIFNTDISTAIQFLMNISKKKPEKCYKTMEKNRLKLENEYV